MRQPAVLAAILAISVAAQGGPTVIARAADGELLIFEAASLRDVFTRLAPGFEKEHPGTKIVANAAGTQELRAQIEQGAAADVFASADRKHMDALRTQGLVDAPEVFACNQPVVVLRKDLNPAIRDFRDLARVDRIVVGTPEVPIGAYTAQILQKAAARYGADFRVAVEAKVVSRELNVRQVLAKVTLGEADAGVVYRSDAQAGVSQGKVRVVSIPDDLNVTAEYPIAVLKKSHAAALAKSWIALVRSPAGVAALGEAGFVACRQK